jgi:hypothetical protein
MNNYFNGGTLYTKKNKLYNKHSPPMQIEVNQREILI